ncbi:MAG: hypothetical protein CSYNP_02044 [Syntrophus sp. SKADARSKE-3]|nr:hypothetical protein [Syntrophus sp. SKADARSKE-3]
MEISLNTTPSTETLHEIKWKALRIRPFLEGKDARWATKAKAEYETLVDHLHDACRGMMTPEQCDVAKKDFEYFITMLVHAEANSKEDKGTN